jgi:hypothetical protein
MSPKCHDSICSLLTICKDVFDANGYVPEIPDREFLCTILCQAMLDTHSKNWSS